LPHLSPVVRRDDDIATIAILDEIMEREFGALDSEDINIVSLAQYPTLKVAAVEGPTFTASKVKFFVNGRYEKTEHHPPFTLDLSSYVFGDEFVITAQPYHGYKAGEKKSVKVEIVA